MKDATVGCVLAPNTTVTQATAGWATGVFQALAGTPTAIDLNSGKLSCDLNLGVANVSGGVTGGLNRKPLNVIVHLIAGSATVGNATLDFGVQYSSDAGTTWTLLTGNPLNKGTDEWPLSIVVGTAATPTILNYEFYTDARLIRFVWKVTSANNFSVQFEAYIAPAAEGQG